MKIIDRTLGMCPKCMVWVKSQVIDRDGEVFLQKICPEHGMTEMLLCKDAAHFSSLRDFYFKTHNKIFSQTRYLCFLTPQCNLSCPICFLDPHSGHRQDVNIEDLRVKLKDNKQELILFGAEPACRDDLFEVIAYLRERQHSVSFYTNGIRLADYRYCEKIKEAKIDKVYLQFDGFDDKVYEILRGKKLVDIKSKVLDNLKQLNLPVVLDVTVVKGLNDDEVGKVFDFSMANDFIRAVNLIAYVRSGGGGDYLSECSTMPDDIIEYMSKYTGGRISREKIRVFQKLLYVYMAFLKRRTCFYIQYFWVYRCADGKYITLNEILDFTVLEKVLDRYLSIDIRMGRLLAILYLSLSLPRLIFAVKNIRLFFELIKMAFAHSFNKGEYASKSSKFLQLIFTTACDPHKSDMKIVERCHVGIIYKNGQGNLNVDDENGRYLLNQEILSKQKAGIV
ncbi:MAG: radical SAM protein [Candidatus Omnitrophota bacterium]